MSNVKYCAEHDLRHMDVDQRVRDLKQLLDAALMREEKLIAALETLLNDSQHSNHDCGNEKCPVYCARLALAENQALRNQKDE